MGSADSTSAAMNVAASSTTGRPTPGGGFGAAVALANRTSEAQETTASGANSPRPRPAPAARAPLERGSGKALATMGVSRQTRVLAIAFV